MPSPLARSCPLIIGLLSRCHPLISALAWQRRPYSTSCVFIFNFFLFSLSFSRSNNVRCKVCFKSIGDAEFYRTCDTCAKRVCEDCSASYKAKDDGGADKVIITTTRGRLSWRTVNKNKKGDDKKQG